MAVQYDLMLHAYMLSQSGVPVIYSGDEIAQENDYTYHKNPKLWEDSRYLHRGKFNWELAEKRNNENSIQGKAYKGLKTLIYIRKSDNIFSGEADVRTLDTWDDSILGIIRVNNDNKLIELYNFSEYERIAWINETDGLYTDLLSGNIFEAKAIKIPPYGFYWLRKQSK